MSEQFINLPIEEKSLILRQAEAQLDKSAFILEKDVWLCWAMQKLFEMPHAMSFKGGTSLSKIYNLISRFSEDLDITIDYKNFSSELTLEKLSKSALKKESEKLKIALINHVNVEILPHLQASIENDNLQNELTLTISENGENVWVNYKSALATPGPYIDSAILIEFGARNSTLPNEQQFLKTEVESIFPDLHFPSSRISVLSPIRTFWEKATLIHVECNRRRLQDSPARLSRHWYDLYMLSNSWVGEQALSSFEVFIDVIQHKTAFYNSSYANYDQCQKGQLKLIPVASEIEGLKTDYKNMIDNGMFETTPPLFDEIITLLDELEENFNKIIRAQLLK